MSAEDKRLRVQVTENPDRVFRGFKNLGKKIDVTPDGSTCLHDLSRLAGTREEVLLVVTKDGRVIIAGTSLSIDDREEFELRSWYDFNATWFYAKDKTFGRSVGERFSGRWQVSVKDIRKRFVKERGDFDHSVAEYLISRTDSSSPTQREEIRDAIRDFASSDFATRERATERLKKTNVAHLALLADAAASTTDAESRQRIRKVI